ncbi:MAG: UbiA family prenyltransferase [Candidatus Thermoplasmatota archaeon]|nr:UbiA family prenyltransferase [Candidatus Thermoplasmatota archaeon]
MRGKIADYVKFLRLPGLGGLAVPPVFGAISAGVYDMHILVVLFIVGALSAIYGFALNDYADVELDGLIKELRDKPLVKGTISRKNAVAVCLIAMMFIFFFSFILWHEKNLDDYKFAAIVSLVLAGVLGSIYDLYGKKIPGSDFFVAISISLVFLYGALAVVDNNLGILTWIIFMLTFNQTLHMNAIEGGIKDADHDYIMGVRNIALLSGVEVRGGRIRIPSVFKLLGVGIRSFSAVLVFVPFFYGMDYYPWQIALLAVMLAGILYIEMKLVALKKFDRKKIRKLIAGATFLRYSVVPVMLISLIGIAGGATLAILPVVWYTAFTPLAGTKIFQPEM